MSHNLKSGKHSSHGTSTGSRYGPQYDGKQSKPRQSLKIVPNTARSHPSSRTTGDIGVSFLFVVNEARLSSNYQSTADRWGNNIPPETYSSYTDETVGKVFRYDSGIVSPSKEYTWFHPGRGAAGAIGWWEKMYDESENLVDQFQPLDVYSTFTVFNCGPFLPSIWSSGDVTVNSSDTFTGWHALHFCHADGVSQASPNGSKKVVAGKNADFIDVILPRIFKNEYKNDIDRPEKETPPSQGLAGELGLVIGLLALSQKRGKIDLAFHENHWRQNRWTGQRHPSAWPKIHDEPRGVTVHIALDPDGRPGSLAEDIYNFEWYSIAVKG
ncbi:hypothetical protein BJ170DRAFT_687361 [Xylariales sp. AK1849]|nr:hypothetical protein BJ170DRAFT_687361 [Xylariales sp. AK1849]